MKPIQWNHEMSVGVPSLDSDHRCLIRIINLLHDVNPEESGRTMETVLETLLLYGRFHFTREETVMAASAFPGIRVHAGEHRRFTAFVQNLRDTWRSQPSARTAGRLYTYLSDWLLHHILIQDMAFKPYVIGRRHPRARAQLAAPSLTLPVQAAELLVR
jgi:hemerythrin